MSSAVFPDDADAPRQGRYTLLLLIGIMGAGLVLRLLMLSASLPTGQYPLILDEGNYAGLATSLTQGQGFVDKWVWLRPPAYPIFLAASMLLSDGGLVLAAWLQVFLSVANIGLLYALTVDVFTLREEVPRGRAEGAGL